MTKRDPFKYFKTSPEIIRLAVMMHVRFPLSLRNVEDLLHERGVVEVVEAVMDDGGQVLIAADHEGEAPAEFIQGSVAA